MFYKHAIIYTYFYIFCILTPITFLNVSYVLGTVLQVSGGYTRWWKTLTFWMSSSTLSGKQAE